MSNNLSNRYLTNPPSNTTFSMNENAQQIESPYPSMWPLQSQSKQGHLNPQLPQQQLNTPSGSPAQRVQHLSSQSNQGQPPQLLTPSSLQGYRTATTSRASQSSIYSDLSLSPSPSFQQPSAYQSEPDVAIPEPNVSFMHGPTPGSQQRQALPLPVTFPQLVKSIRGAGFSPFSRGYAPALAASDINLEDWLAFVDGLNIVFTADPPLQILGLAGGIIGMVPHHIPIMIGHGIGALAQIGTRATTKLRSDNYISDANEKFFNPRGLAVVICSTKDMAEAINHPDGTNLTLPPLTSVEDVNASAMARRYLAFEGLVCPVTFENMPPAEIPDSVLQKISAQQVARQTKSQEKKIIEERQKELEERDKNAKENAKEAHKVEKKVLKEIKKQEEKVVDVEKKIREVDSKVAKEDTKARKDMLKKGHKPKDAAEIEKKRSEELTKLGKERTKLERQREKEVDKLMDNLGGKEVMEKKDKKSKEEKALQKVLWIVVTNL